MKTKRTLFAFFILIAIIAVLMGVTGRATHAQSSSDSDSIVLNKLNEVLSSQKAMMEDLSAIKEKLRIIEVRVTQSQ